MEDSVLLYALWSICVAICVALFFVWLENIIKIILGNYILWFMCFAASLGIDNLLLYLSRVEEAAFLWLSASWWTNFLSNGHATIILLVYVLLLVFVYKKSTLSIRIPWEIAIQRTLYLVFVPLALVSIILTLYVLAWGVGIVSPSVLQELASNGGSMAIVAQILSLVPVWIFVHGLLTLLLSASLPARIETDLTDFSTM